MITPQIQVLIRVEQEKLELDEKLTKLRAFQRTDIFSKIDAVSQTLLNVQEQIMSAYSQILLERLAHMKFHDEKPSV